MSYLDAILGGTGKKASFTQTTAAYTQPAVSATVVIAVADNSWIPVGLALFVATGGAYVVTAVNADGVHVTIQNTGASGNAAAASTVPTAQRVTAAGAPGATGATGAAGTGIAPVDYVQIQNSFYYTFTYSAVTQKLTATVNGALPSLFFGAALSAGQSIEWNSSYGLPVGSADQINGVYVVLDPGTGGTPFQAIRRSDFNSTQELANGATYSVRLGQYAGTLRTMVTVAPTLDTTPIAFTAAASTSLIYVDLAKTYGVRAFASGADWFANGNFSVGNAAKINQALWDYRSTPALLKLPAGIVLVETPLDIWGGGTVLQGAGRGLTTISPAGIGGGNNFKGGHLICAYNVESYPLVGGTLVDQTAGSTPIALYKSASALAYQYFFNLMHAGVLFENFAQFECKMMFRLDALTSGSSLHLVSCRGRRSGNDPTDVCFSIFQNTANVLVAQLRSTDTTAGVYDAVSQSGGGSSVMTGDGTVKPTNDCTIVVKVLVGGTIGTADAKSIVYSMNGGRLWSTPIALGTATSYTTTDCNDYEQDVLFKVNFSAGTLVAGATYTTVCSGVNQTVTLTHGTTLAINTNYCVTLQLVGGNARLNLGVADGSSASTTVTAAATGGLNRYYWETPVIGNGANVDLACANGDSNAINGYLGSIRILKSNVSAITTAAAATTLANFVTGQAFYWRPNTTDKQNDPGGNLRRWIGYLDNVGSNNQAYIDPIRLYGAATSFVPAFGGLEDFTSDCAGTFVSHIFSNTWARHRFRNLQMRQGNTQLTLCCFAGSDFDSTNENISVLGGYGWGLCAVNGACSMGGNWSFVEGTGHRVQIVGCLSTFMQTGTCFINTEFYEQNALCLSNCNGLFSRLDIDTEGQSGQKRGAVLYTSTGPNLKLNGQWDLIGGFLPICNAGVANNGITELTMIGAIGATNHCFVDAKYAAAPLSIIGALTPLYPTVPLSSRAGKAITAGSRLPATTLTGATNTLTWGKYGSFKRAAANLSGNATTTLSPTGMLEGDTFTITSGVQGFTEAFINGGPSGGTLLTAAVGFIGTLTFRMNFVGDLEWI